MRFRAQAGSRFCRVPACGSVIAMTEVAVRPELVPPELLERVVRFFDPELVILFGSRARGEADTDSDIDLLVVLDDEVPAENLGWRSAFEARKDYHRAVDIVPCRRRWFEDKRRVIGSLAHMAAEHGVVVYVRH